MIERVPQDLRSTATRRGSNEWVNGRSSDNRRSCCRALGGRKSRDGVLRSRGPLLAAGRVAPYGRCRLDRSCDRSKWLQKDWLYGECPGDRHRRAAPVGSRPLRVGESKQDAPQIRASRCHHRRCPDSLQLSPRGVARAGVERVDRGWAYDAQAPAPQGATRANSGEHCNTLMARLRPPSGDIPEHWPSRTPRLRVDWCCHVELVRRLGGPIRGLVH
jgi:hypothetical protein